LNYPGNGAARPVPLGSPTELVELWWCALAVDDASLHELSSWLSPAEHARARRYSRPALARRYVAGRAALRWILARETNVAPRNVAIDRGVRGRPFAAGAPDFNVSNTAGVALIGVCRDATARIGVDVEHHERRVDHARLSRKFLTADERHDLEPLDDDARRRAFLRLWTCKEAMSKATGDALRAPMGRMRVARTPELHLADGPPPYVPAAWRLYAADVPAPFLATFALWRPHVV
jgi:4'-phosphopantetheinyl transferase